MRVGVPADACIMLPKWVRHPGPELRPRRKHWAGMAVPKKRMNRTAGPEVDDLWAWAVIGVIVGCVTLVLWLPLLKQVFG